MTCKGSSLQSHCVCVVASPASVLGETGKSTSSFSSPGSNESELEEGRESEHGAIEPYMYEPVASNESDDAESDSDESEVEERRQLAGRC